MDAPHGARPGSNTTRFPTLSQGQFANLSPEHQASVQAFAARKGMSALDVMDLENPAQNLELVKALNLNSMEELQGVLSRALPDFTEIRQSGNSLPTPQQAQFARLPANVRAGIEKLAEQKDLPLTNPNNLSNLDMDSPDFVIELASVVNISAEQLSRILSQAKPDFTDNH
jgi:hypothetical protein